MNGLVKAGFDWDGPLLSKLVPSFRSTVTLTKMWLLVGTFLLQVSGCHVIFMPVVLLSPN